MNNNYRQLISRQDQRTKEIVEAMMRRKDLRQYLNNYRYGWMNCLSFQQLRLSGTETIKTGTS